MLDITFTILITTLLHRIVFFIYAVLVIATIYIHFARTREKLPAIFIDKKPDSVRLY